MYRSLSQNATLLKPLFDASYHWYLSFFLRAEFCHWNVSRNPTRIPLRKATSCLLFLKSIDNYGAVHTTVYKYVACPQVNGFLEFMNICPGTIVNYCFLIVFLLVMEALSLSKFQNQHRTLLNHAYSK